MLIPPFWRGRGKHVPAGNRLARFRAVVKAAHRFPLYLDRLAAANLGTPALVEAVRDIDLALAALAPLPYENYRALFIDRQPSWRQRPHRHETRSAFLIRYQLARSGLDTCHAQTDSVADLYSPTALAGATADLVHIARALDTPSSHRTWQSDHAVAAFSGIDAGLLTSDQRDDLWKTYQVPLFEQFLGTDGRVIAAECEVHDGLHIRPDAAVVQSVNDELVITSLTDEESPALRVRSGLTGTIETEACECGRVAPRLIRLRRMPASQTSAAVA